MSVAVKVFKKPSEDVAVRTRKDWKEIVASFTAKGITMVRNDQNPDVVLILNVPADPDEIDQYVAALEGNSVVTNQSSQAIAFECNRAALLTHLSNAGVSVPAFVETTYASNYQDVVSAVGSPFYYRHVEGQNSRNIQFIMSEDDFVPKDGWMAIQYIGTAGTDYTSTLVRDEAINLVKRRANNYLSFLSVPQGNATSRPITDTNFEEVEPLNLATSGFKTFLDSVAAALPIEIATVNFVVDKQGNPYVIDVNWNCTYYVAPLITGIDTLGIYADTLIARNLHL